MMGRIMTLILWLGILPVLAGFLPMVILTKGDPSMRKGSLDGLLLSWLAGQTLLWALFQLAAVPYILLERTLSDLVRTYGILCLILSGMGVMGLLVVGEKNQWSLSCLDVRKAGKAGKAGNAGNTGNASEGKWSMAEKLLFAGFLALLLFQLIQAVRLAYGDGDDAYYVAVSALAENGDTMYRKLAYTGGTTQLDIRHGLAPFPMWIAFLVRKSGVPTAIMAHIAMPLFMIPMAYAVFYLIGRRIWKGERAGLWGFMVLTQVLVLFGNYSLYSAESFMIARSRQGKAALGSMIFPFMFYLLLLVLERLKDNRRLGGTLWMLLAALVTGACLCSTLGALLSCMLIGAAGLCTAIAYRRIWILFPLAAACLPAFLYAFLYIRLG